jgi:hypothetical protein
MDKMPVLAVISRFMIFKYLPLLLVTWTGLWADSEDEVVGRLMSARSLSALKVAEAAAVKLEMPAQQRLEARLFYGIRTLDLDYLKSIRPGLDEAALDFRPSLSIAGLRSSDQFRGMLAYALALEAKEERNAEEFRSAIDRAMWLCPQRAEMYGASVESFQMQEKISRWVIDFSIPILTVGGQQKPLGEVLGSHKAVLIYYWAKGATESVEAIASMEIVAQTLAAHRILTIGMHVDPKDTEVEAQKVQKQLKVQMPWFLEDEDEKLSHLLELTSIPRAVLINRQGRVLYHDHPLSYSLWKVLKKISPTILPPER